MKLVALDEGRATVTLPADAPTLSAPGNVRRGAITVLVEAAAIAAALGTERWASDEQAASELFLSFLRPVPDHPLTAEAHVVSQSGRRRSCEVEVCDWNGELVAKGFLSCEV